MKRKAFLHCLSFAVMTVFCLSQAIPLQAKTHELRMQAVFPATGPSGQLFQEWADRVESNTKGQVKVKIFPPNQLVKLNEAYDATAKGMIDGCLSSLIYYGGTIPEGKTAFLSYTWKSPAQLSDLFLEKGYLELLRKANAQHNVRYVTPLMVGSFGFITKFPVKSLEDLKGKKFRASGMDGQLVKIAGAAGVALPVGEIYMALQRGTVDGIIYPYYTMDSYKFYEVVSHMVLPGIRQPSITSVFMNLDVWNALPKDLQNDIDAASRDTFLGSAEKSLKWDQEAIETCNKHGVTVVTLPESDVQTLKAQCMGLWDEVAAESPLCKEIIDLFKSTLK